MNRGITSFKLSPSTPKSKHRPSPQIEKAFLDDDQNWKESLLVNAYQDALKKDQNKHAFLHQRLNSTVFNKKSGKARRQDSLKEKSKNKGVRFVDESVSQDLRETIRESVELGVKPFRSITPSRLTRRRNKIKHRYSQPQVMASPYTSFSTPKTPRFDDSEFLNTSFSKKIGNIIELGHGHKTNPIFKHRKVPTPSQRQRMMEAQDKEQRERILNDLVEKEVEMMVKPKKYRSTESRRNGKSLGRLSAKVDNMEGIQDLTNQQKYTMSFNTYVRNKTLKNISQQIYDEKVKQSSNYVQKFQSYILKEFKLGATTKRNIHRVFKQIAADLAKPTKSILGP